MVFALSHFRSASVSDNSFLTQSDYIDVCSIVELTASSSFVAMLFESLLSMRFEPYMTAILLSIYPAKM